MATKTVEDVRDFFSTLASSISMHFIEGNELTVVNDKHGAASMLAFMMPETVETTSTSGAIHNVTLYACGRANQNTQTGDVNHEWLTERFAEIENKVDVQMKLDLSSTNDIWLIGEVRKQRLPAQAAERWYMVRYDIQIGVKVSCWY